MIRLTVEAPSGRKVFAFDKETIFIAALDGDKAQDDIDIVVPEKALKAAHIQITSTSDGLVAINPAELAEIKINGQTFAKSPFMDGDLLEIGSWVFMPASVDTTLVTKVDARIDELDRKIAQELADLDINTIDLGDIENDLASIKEAAAASLEISEEELSSLFTGIERRPVVREVPVPEVLPEAVTEPAPSPVFDAVEIAQDDIDLLKGILDDAEPEIKEAVKGPADAIDFDFLLKEAGKIEETSVRMHQASKDELSDLDHLFTEGTELPVEAKSAEIEEAEAAELAETTTQEFVQSSPGSIDDYNEPDDWDEELLSKLNKHKRSKRLRQAAWIGLAACLVLCLGAIGTYVVKSQENHKFEMLAARQLSDLAMAFKEAELHGSLDEMRSPLKWQAHLERVLPAVYLTNEVVGTDLHFAEVPFTLEMLISPDNDSFLLLARPQESAWQQFIPKATLAIRSESMELRRVANIDEERDSFAAETLPSASPDTVIATDFLEEETACLGFASGVTGAIYNAPRYYNLTSELILTAQNYELSKTPDDKKAAKEALQTELTRFAKLRNLTVYMIGDVETAAKLGTLLAQESRRSDVRAASLRIDNKLIAGFELPTLIQDSTHTKADEKLAVAPTLRADNPFESLLSGLVNERKSALKTARDAINDFQEQHENSGTEDSAALASLNQRYADISTQYKKQLQDTLQELYTRCEVPGSTYHLADLQDAITALQLESFVTSSLAKISSHEAKLTAERFASLLDTLQNEKDMNALEQLTTDLAAKIDNTELTERSNAAGFQKQFQEAILAKVKQITLEPDTAATRYSLADRRGLESLLRAAKISQAEEKQYYLAEFEHLCQMQAELLPQSDINELEKIHREVKDNIEANPDLSPEQKKNLTAAKDSDIRSLDKIKDQQLALTEAISQIPLSSLSASSNSVTDLGRYGQQMVVWASSQPPTDARDTTLMQAISLLSQGQAEDRKLWGSILQARRLGLQWPQAQIANLLDATSLSKLQNFGSSAGQTLDAYAKAKTRVVMATEPAQLKAEWSLYQQVQAGALQKLVADIHSTKDTIARLEAAFSVYTQRQKELLSDTSKAGQQGYLELVDRRAAQIEFSKLTKTQSQLSQLLGKLRTFRAETTESLLALENRCGIELAELSSESPSFARDNIDSLSRDSAVTRNIDLNPDGLLKLILSSVNP